MKTMAVKTKDKNRFLQGMDFLSYALEIFAFIGFELVLAYGIEFNVYGCDFSGFSMWQTYSAPGINLRCMAFWCMVCSQGLCQELRCRYH